MASEQEQVPAQQDLDEAIEVPKRNQTPAEPPVTFREFNVSPLLTSTGTNSYKWAKLSLRSFNFQKHPPFSPINQLLMYFLVDT